MEINRNLKRDKRKVTVKFNDFGLKLGSMECNYSKRPRDPNDIVSFKRVRNKKFEQSRPLGQTVGFSEGWL